VVRINSGPQFLTFVAGWLKRAVTLLTARDRDAKPSIPAMQGGQFDVIGGVLSSPALHEPDHARCHRSKNNDNGKHFKISNMG
jgi:hypothetical protein